MLYRVSVQTSTMIYFDHQAATPIDPFVYEAMDPYLRSEFANPHTDAYPEALAAREAVEEARAKIAHSIKVSTASIVFTSGATEANNMAILGACGAVRPTSKRKCFVTVCTEHKSVLEPARSLKNLGYGVGVMKVGRNGLVDLDDFRLALGSNTFMASVMLVNNETGVIQPIAELASICKTKGVLLHSDCSQALGKIPVDLRSLGVDLATFSSHKSYGPKGIAVLYVRRRPMIPIKPILLGGAQEGGLRPGTLPVALCVGFGEAAIIASRRVRRDGKKLAKLTDNLWAGIRKIYPKAKLNTGQATTAPGCMSITFPDCRAESLMKGLKGVCVSAGSACNALGTEETSYVLKGMRLSDNEAACTLRFGLGRFTTESEVSDVLSILKRILPKISRAA